MSQIRKWEVWDSARVKHYVKNYGTPNKPEKHHGNRMKLAASLVEGRSILDVGCGVGHLYPHVHKETRRYLGVDNSREMLEAARKYNPTAEFRYADIYNLEKLDQSDTVICQSLLIHLPETKRPIRQLWGKTRQALIISLPLGNKPTIKPVKKLGDKTLLLNTGTWNTIRQTILKLRGIHQISKHPEPKSSIGNTYIKIIKH